MSEEENAIPTKRGRTDILIKSDKKLSSNVGQQGANLHPTAVSHSLHSKPSTACHTRKQKTSVQEDKLKGEPIPLPQNNPASTEINEATWKWFQKAISMHVQVTGSMIQATALRFAIEFGNAAFKVTNAWLQAFRLAHNIPNGRSGESAGAGDEQCDIMGSFFAELPELCSSYLPEDVFNAVEVGLLYKALPCKRTDRLSSNVGDSQTDYLTILLATSAAGERLMPIVIGKDAPNFPENGSEILPVEWRRNLKAWMTSRSFVQWLNNLNVGMSGDGRHIILFLSSCLAHPNVELSNVRLCFFPPKQSSGILPLHHGVTQAFKGSYRRKFLKALVARSAAVADVGETLSTVTILDAAGWIDAAWKSLPDDSITRAFESAGFPIALPPELEDEGVLDTRLCDLIRQTGEMFSLPFPLLTETEYVNVDSWVPVYPTIDFVIPHMGPLNNLISPAVMASNCSQKVLPNGAIVNDSKCTGMEIPSNEEVRVMIQKLKKYALVKKPEILDDILKLESHVSGTSQKGGESRWCCECNKEKQIIVLD